MLYTVFQGANAFNRDLSKWDVSAVPDSDEGGMKDSTWKTVFYGRIYFTCSRFLFFSDSSNISGLISNP